MGAFDRRKHPARDAIKQLRHGEHVEFQPADLAERVRIEKIVSNLRYSGRKDIYLRESLGDSKTLIVYSKGPLPAVSASPASPAAAPPAYSVTLTFATQAELNAALRRLAGVTEEVDGAGERQFLAEAQMYFKGDK